MEWYPKRRFGDLADEIASRFPDIEGLVYEERRYTFAKIAAEIDKAAKRLIAIGVEPGEKVALWLNNSDDWIFIAFAVHKIGAVLVPINTRFRSRDLEYVLKQSDSAILVAHDRSGPVDYSEMVHQVVSLPPDGQPVSDEGFPLLRGVILISEEHYTGTLRWSDLDGNSKMISDGALAERANAVDPDSPTLIMYTSGTTGFPKGAVHTHKLVRNNEERAWRMAITHNDVILNYLPLFHTFGYSEGALMSFLTGATHVITRTFDPHESLDLIQNEKVTIAHGFEVHMKGLTEAQEDKPRDISSLRVGIFAAGMLSATPVTRNGARVLAPIKNISGFGMTETWIGVALCSIDDDEAHRCESSGYPGIGYEIRIVDPDTLEPCDIGVPGELQVRGFSLMLGYYKKLEETSASFTDDGWFRTGDTAIWLADGYIRLLGRRKDMLKVGGENVDPMETEGLLLEHPSIHQVAVVGVTDGRLSEVAVAYIEKVPAAELSVADVISHCRGQIASFKIPRHVVFVDEFSMTASGKIIKTELREDARARFAATLTRVN